MTFEPRHGFFAQCPSCDAETLACPEHPRGDDVVECRVCGHRTSYAIAEARALDHAREHLARRFPYLAR